MQPVRLAIAFALAGVAALSLSAAPATAALYKWTDANGRVVYSGQPPNADVKVESVQGASPPSTPDAARELARKAAELNRRSSERRDATDKADKARADQSAHAVECAKVAEARKRLDWSQVALYRTDERGQRVPMDEAARQRERVRLDTYTRQHCG